jgi:hypothetical protein
MAGLYLAHTASELAQCLDVVMTILHKPGQGIYSESI